LGYGRGELLGRSWYRLLHPEDLSHVARQHLRLAGAGAEARGELVTRLQRKDGLGWTWVYARLRPEGPALLAHNFVIRSHQPQGTQVSRHPQGKPNPFGPSLDFPGAGIGAGDLSVGVGLGVGPGVGSSIDLGVGSGLGDDVGDNVGVNVGLGLGVNIGCGLGA
ncbi:NPAS4 protein, partial [Ciconia maguari]|nr:NPAS4 protein [Ciconia maguari]